MSRVVQAAADDLKSQLWAECQALGFSKMRVCRPDAALPEAEHHGKWLSRGHAADMHYLSRDYEQRYDARSLLPECKSVIVLALGYYQESRQSDEAAKVAMYAWGDNYHNVIRSKLKRLGRWLDERVPDHRWRPTVDSAPLAEKAFAVAAGIGWLGRNSLVLDQALGSYFFLACLLSSAELPLDSAIESACGTCTLCIQECPTNALLGPGILAAERCVSYHNTEARQAPTAETTLNGWLFGCDTCQRVCPYNVQVPATREPRFAPSRGLLHLTAEEAGQMSEEEFNARFTGSTIRRRKYPRFQAAAAALLQQAVDS